MNGAQHHPIDVIFADFKGPAAVARILGVRGSTASEMKRRRSIPVRYWPALLAAATAAEISLTESDLVRIHAERASKPSACSREIAA